MTLTFLDPRTGRLVTIKVPEKFPRQPLQPVMRPSRWDPWLGGQGTVGAYVAGLNDEKRQLIEHHLRLA